MDLYGIDHISKITCSEEAPSLEKHT